MKCKQSSQLGRSAISWLFLLFIIVFIAQLAVKVIPVYLDDRLLVESFKSLSDRDDFSSMSPNEVREALSNIFDVNSLDGEGVESVNIKRKGIDLLVTAEYEKRIPLLANIDLVMSFNHTLDSSAPEDCCD